MIRLPEPDYRARFALMGYGLLVFVWMSLEDNGTLTVSLLGAGLATALILYQTFKRFAGEELATRFLFPLLGLLIGAASPIATILLMFFKTAWHGHEFPDYPLELMRDMLFRLPAWALAGGLIGLGLAFAWATKQEKA
jgi:multisubunit Na+/H+ antiporter MnhE subunit